MCSNDSPSVKADGTTDAATLAADYEESLLDVEEQPLPSYRTDEIRVRIEEVRQTLAVEGVASAGQLQQLLRTVTEALADVRAARVVPVPEGRDLSAAVPGANDTGAAYEVTATEQRKATSVLLDLLFTVVETPTHEDRRRREERVARDDGHGDESETQDSDAHDDTDASGTGDADSTGTSDTEASHRLGIEGYAGPE